MSKSRKKYGFPRFFSKLKKLRADQGAPQIRASAQSMEGCRPRHPLCHSKGAEGDAPPFQISFLRFAPVAHPGPNARLARSTKRWRAGFVEPHSLRPAFLRARGFGLPATDDAPAFHWWGRIAEVTHYFLWRAAPNPTSRTPRRGIPTKGGTRPSGLPCRS